MIHGSQDIQQAGRQVEVSEKVESGSQKCTHRSRRVGPEKSCKVCGEKFLDYYHGIGKYCSRKCAAIGRRKTDPTRTCEVCGNGFRRSPSQSIGAKFCSQQCRVIGMRGKPNPKPARGFDLSIVAFWTKVDKRGSDECWPWNGCKLGMGYGRFRSEGKFICAHRFSYIIHFGPLPDGKPCVLHHCDNPPCCNPKHLFAGTKQENTDDCIRKGRHPWQYKIRDTNR